MHPTIENILERPASHKAIIWIVSLVVICGGFYSLVYSDKLTKRDELTEKVAGLESSIMTEKRLAQRLPQAREKLKDLEIKLQQALQELPDKSEVDDLLERISNLARESGLELNLFQRRDDSLKEFYAEVPVNVAVSGAFHQVATFFDEVGRLPRIVNITNIALFDPKITEDEVTVKVECALTAFRYLSETERSQAAPADKKKRK